MTINIGQVDVATLNIYRGADLDFDVTWTDSAGAAVDISRIESSVRASLTGEVLLSLDGYADITANTAQILVPADVTAELETMRAGVWEFRAIATDSDEHKAMLRGTARVFTAIAAVEGS